MNDKKNKLHFGGLIIISAVIIITFSGTLSNGNFWGVKIAFGYGGGGGGGGSSDSSSNTNEQPVPVVISPPTIEPFSSPTAENSIVLKGTRATGTLIYINGSTVNLNYPTDTTWQASLALSEGGNSFAILAKDDLGNESSSILALVTYEIAAPQILGDISNDKKIDDLDLALLVSHWNKNWSAGDINKDGIIDDLDLALLVSHWS